MKSFKLSPKKDFKIEVKVDGNYEYWCALFRELLMTDVFAPMLIVAGHLPYVVDSACPWLVTPYAQRYAWIGELMTDAEREEIYDAAKKTGLFSQGLNDFCVFALSNDDRKAIYGPVVKEVLAREWYAKQLSARTVAFCMRELRVC